MLIPVLYQSRKFWMNSTVTRDFDLIDQLEDIGIKLTDTTKRNVNGFCPVHSPDTHPSFYFNLDTELYQCFGCDLRGKGIDRLRFQVTGETVKTRYVNSEIKIIHHGEIPWKPEPIIPVLPPAIYNEGEQYLLGRGFTQETIKSFGILFWKADDCIVIPLERMGYVKRFLHPKPGEKKYWYIPGSDIDSDLFGISHYSPGLVKGAILVEGAFDAIWLHQLGYTTALAILHSDVSSQQLRVLKGVTSKIYLMLDNDRGGIETTGKIEKKLKEAAFIVRKCELPEGKDPNDCNKEQIEFAIKN